MYYHLNPEFNKTFPTLKPFIPKYLLEYCNQEINTLENRTIPRVCVSSDISKAFFALTWTTFFLENLVSNRYSLYMEGFIDARTEEIGLPMRVYVVEDEPDFSNEDILANNFVFDAKETKEAWFFNEVKPTKSFVFFVKGSFEKDNERFIDGYVIDQDEMLFLVNPTDYFFFVEDNVALEGMSLEEKLNTFHLDEKALFSENNSKNVELSSELTIIPEGAFKKNQIESVVIKDKVRTIRKDAFENNKIISLELGSSVGYIVSHAFNMNPLLELTLPSNVSTVEEFAFYNTSVRKVINKTNISSSTLSKAFSRAVSFVKE